MSGPEFVRLHEPDLPELLTLLQDVWPTQYGATGCPDFSADYLRWLYGGPDAARHLLLGCRLDGRLVAARGALYRRTHGPGGRPSVTWVSTHLTVAPDLDFAQRMAITAELSRVHPLDVPVPADEGNYVISYYEDSKTLARSVIRRAQKLGLHCAETRFRQAILDPRRARAAAAAAEPAEFSPATADDWPVLSKATFRTPPDSLVWTPAPETMAHHATVAPGAEAIVARRHGILTGWMASYVLDWLRAGQRSQMLVVERIEAADDATLAQLLGAAVNRAAVLGLRGTVIENPTLLPDSARRMGVIPSSRVMIMVCRSRDPLPQVERFGIDVK